MRKSILKRVLTATLAVLIAFPLFCVTAFADTGASFQVEDVSGVEANGTFQVSVKYTGDSAVKISGITMVLSYDAEKLAFSGGSEKVLVKNMTGYTVNAKNGKVHFIWDSLDTVTLNPGVIFRVSFSATEKFSDTTVTPSVDSLYVFSGSRLTDITVETLTAGKITAAGTDLAVNAVINAINAIDNPVVYTEACNERINSAWESYLALNAAQKLLVSNYSKLANAIKEYNALREQSKDDPVTAEVENYKNTYEYALSRTKSNATTDKNEDGTYKDITALESAVAALEKLSVQAQVKLMLEKNTMKSVLSYLREQVKEELEEQEREELEKKQRAAAEEAVNDYLSQPFKWVFDLTEDTVKTGDETGVRNALNSLGDYEINKYAVEMLADKKELLEKLLARIEKLKLEENPGKSTEIAAADAFKDAFSYVLSLTPETVTRDDEIDVNIANYAYEMLDDAVKAYLKNEGELLSSLMDAISALPDEDDDYGDDDGDLTGDDENPEKETVIKEVIKRVKDARKYTVKFVRRNMSKIIWIMLGAIAVLLVNYACVSILHRRAKKKSEKEEDK